MKNIFIGIGLFVAGGGVGFLIGKKMLEQKYRLAEEELDEARERYIKACSELRNEPKSGMNPAETEEPEPSSTFSRYVKEGLTRETNPYEKAKENYHLIYKSETAEETRDESDVDEDEENGEIDTNDAYTRDISEINRTLPYTIDVDEFQNEFPHHEKITLYYYAEDDTLCDDQEKLIDDIDGTCGYDCLNGFSMATTVWARNEPLCSDFEILLVNRSYAETVMGVMTDLPFKKTRRVHNDE